VALYTDEGDRIHLKRNRTIEVVSGNKLTATIGNEAEITAPVVVVNAATSCQINGPAINLGGDRGGLLRLIDERFAAVFNGHVHSDVEPGNGNTGTPTTALEVGNHATNAVRGI
jgi:phage gp45-like